MKNRIIAFILLLAMLFGMTSCEQKDEITPKDRPLVVESEDVIYTEEGISEIAEGLVAVADAFAPKLGYPALKEKNREEIRDFARNTLIPIALDNSIYESELLMLCDIALESAEKINKNAPYIDKLGVMADTYARMTAHIDISRLGALIYELDLELMRDKLAEAEERYDRYGYSYYLADVEKYTALIADAENVGAPMFADALSVIMFITSAAFGTIGADDDMLSVKSADALVILRKQSERFSSLNIDEKTWQTVATMCEEFIPDTASSAIHGKLTWTLDDENYFAESAAVMTDVLGFYSIFASDISPEAKLEIDDGTELQLARAVARELLKHRDDFDALLSAIEAKVLPASESTVALIHTYDVDGYSSFCSRYGATKEELIMGVEAFYADPTEEKYEELINLALGFAKSVNPVIAYVYFYL